LPTEVRRMFNSWVEQALEGIKWSILSVNSVINTNLVIFDGHLNRNLLAEINLKLKNLLEDLNWEGTEPVNIESGTIGINARALGSAIIPFNSLYGLSQSTLLKKY